MVSFKRRLVSCKRRLVNFTGILSFARVRVGRAAGGGLLVSISTHQEINNKPALVLQLNPIGWGGGKERGGPANRTPPFQTTGSRWALCKTLHSVDAPKATASFFFLQPNASGFFPSAPARSASIHGQRGFPNPSRRVGGVLRPAGVERVVASLEERRRNWEGGCRNSLLSKRRRSWRRGDPLALGRGKKTPSADTLSGSSGRQAFFFFLSLPPKKTKRPKIDSLKDFQTPERGGERKLEGSREPGCFAFGVLRHRQTGSLLSAPAQSRTWMIDGDRFSRDDNPPPSLPTACGRVTREAGRVRLE